MKDGLNHITLKKFFLFNEVAKSESVSSASRELGLNSQRVRQELNALEEMLGISLFSTNKKNFVLTDEGKIFLIISKGLEENLRKISALWQCPDDIFVATTNGISKFYIPTILKEFRKIYPKIKIFVSTKQDYLNFTSPLVDVVLGPTLTNRTDLSIFFLKTFKYYFFASKDYVAVHGYPKTVNDLINHPFISSPRTALLDGLQQHVSTSIECSSYDAIVNMTRLGLGISSMTKDHLIHSKNEENFVQMLDGVIAEQDKISFMHRDDSRKLSVIHVLKSIAQKIFSDGVDNEKN